MDEATFENELIQLRMMSQDWNFDALFIECYADILEKVKAGDDPILKSEQASRMKELLLLQTAFVTREYLQQREYNAA